MTVRMEVRREWRNERGQLHREDGPAITYTEKPDAWLIRDDECTNLVLEWIEECGINPNWKEWTVAEKTLFKLRFV